MWMARGLGNGVLRATWWWWWGGCIVVWVQHGKAWGTHCRRACTCGHRYNSLRTLSSCTFSATIAKRRATGVQNEPMHATPLCCALWPRMPPPPSPSPRFNERGRIYLNAFDILRPQVDVFGAGAAPALGHNGRVLLAADSADLGLCRYDRPGRYTAARCPF